MNNTPKVSVVVPVYGVEKYLRQCVDSILAQTLRDIEIILVDDGSPDKCPQIIDEYAQKDKRVVAIHKPNGGYGSACNAGLNVATGKYIAICEPDDFIEPDMYETLYLSAIKSDADVVKSNFFYHYDLGHIPPYDIKHKYPKKKGLYDYPTDLFSIKDHPELLWLHPSIWTCIYKRDFIEKHNIRVEEIPGAGWTDNLFQVQTLCLAKKIQYVNKTFYHWRCRNRDEAKDLKDITIPMLRTKTIHKWLRDNNITDSNIWVCLYKREIAYLHIMARAVNKDKIKALQPDIQEMVADINADILNNNPYVIKHEKKARARMENFMSFYRHYRLSRAIDHVISFRRSLLSIHWDSLISPHETSRYIIILGIMLYRFNPDMHKKCFARIKI